ncbi:uncharacterized protein [Dendropsophus ebraccatus]|uniref:uncharacterized protein n=1 Tax=Dendropsophus ebraccatus TaxID=150705 RepID=UPI003831C46F
MTNKPKTYSLRSVPGFGFKDLSDKSVCVNAPLHHCLNHALNPEIRHAYELTQRAISYAKSEMSLNPAGATYFTERRSGLQVYARPLLWDGPAPGYRSRLTRRAAWREVCRIVYPDWDQHTRLQKWIIANYVETRWSSVRDRFIRERRQLMSRGASQQELASLHFAPMLRFILNSSRRRRPQLVQQPAEASSDEENEEHHLAEGVAMTPPRWQEGPVEPGEGDQHLA